MLVLSPEKLNRPAHELKPGPTLGLLMLALATSPQGVSRLLLLLISLLSSPLSFKPTPLILYPSHRRRTVQVAFSNALSNGPLHQKIDLFYFVSRFSVYFCLI